VVTQAMKQRIVVLLAKIAMVATLTKVDEAIGETAATTQTEESASTRLEERVTLATPTKMQGLIWTPVSAMEQ